MALPRNEYVSQFLDRLRYGNGPGLFQLPWLSGSAISNAYAVDATGRCRLNIVVAVTHHNGITWLCAGKHQGLANGRDLVICR